MCRKLGQHRYPKKLFAMTAGLEKACHRCISKIASNGVRQTKRCVTKKLHDASSCQGPEYLPVQQGQKQKVAIKPQAEV
ncbi:hypothetical protein AAES_164350 [Amazona aestiva]|uniref:Uncharacterized protein n=1 Tax=Amazona aestiva TaxID=12930 RepID=A0A0Q3LTX9_AMAAE|nr:hypothetical protein AAES_164350 [Amazona aestiva]